MRTAAFQPMRAAMAQREVDDADARVRSLRRTKIFFGIVLAVLFWFSVPYHVPNHAPDTAGSIAIADNAEQFGGSLSRQLAVPAIGLVSLYLLWRLPRRERFAGRLRWAVVGYLLLVAASALWSDEPALTLKRLLVFGIDALAATTLAMTATAMELALWAMVSTFAVALISLGVDLFVLRLFAPFDPAYRLTGVMTANYQAMNLVVCSVCAAVLMLRKPRWVPWLWTVLGTAVLLLLLTRSRVAVVLALVLVGVVLVRVARHRLQPTQRALVLLAVLAFLLPVGVYLAGSNLRGAAQGAFMLGRDDAGNTGSLSNRLPLWTELLSSVAQRPWLGVGYGGFWNVARADRISRDQGWAVPNAHNTFLDQVLILGWPGGVLYAAILLTAVVLAWHRYRAAGAPADLLNALLLTWLLLLSTAESTPLEPHLPTLMAYIALVRMCRMQAAAAQDADAPIVEGLPGKDVSGAALPLPERLAMLPVFPARHRVRL